MYPLENVGKKPNSWFIIREKQVKMPLRHKNFKLYNERIFQKGKKRRKRFECVEVKTGKLYLFNPNAEVELIE